YEDAPGDHAGIATSVGTSFSFAGLRAWMRALQQSLWCVSFDDSHVDAKTLFDAVGRGNANLRGGDSWRNLAKHPVCGHCHARMDYGWQFFIGFADERIAGHYIPPKGKFAEGLQLIGADKFDGDARKTMGKLYVDDINDYRGEQLRTPLNYLKWAVAQPEFGACQSRRVVDEVFGRNATPADRDAIADVFKNTGQFRPMMREALRRFVKHKMTDAPPPPEAPPHFLAATPTTTANNTIALLPETKALLEKNC